MAKGKATCWVVAGAFAVSRCARTPSPSPEQSASPVWAYGVAASLRKCPARHPAASNSGSAARDLGVARSVSSRAW